MALSGKLRESVLRVAREWFSFISTEETNHDLPDHGIMSVGLKVQRTIKRTEMCARAQKDCAEHGNCLVVTYTDDYGVVFKRGRCSEATCIEPQLKDADSLKLTRDCMTKSGS